MTHDPKSGEKLRVSLDKIAKEYAGRTRTKASALIEAFVPDEDSAEKVEDLVGDSIFRYLLASAKMIRASSTDRTFDEGLDHFIARKTRLTGELAKRLRQLLKQAVLTTEEARPKNDTKSRIRSKQKDKNCYLCSRPLTDETSILDHVWPRSAGGGNGKSNLRVAHESCEGIKGDIAVSGDVAISRFAFAQPPMALTAIPKALWPVSLNSDSDFRSFADDLRSSQFRIAILCKQNFQCSRCSKEFSDSDDLVLTRIDGTAPWWFPNTIAVCDECERRNKK